jgi:Protein of unknown function (DUF1759)
VDEADIEYLIDDLECSFVELKMAATAVKEKTHPKEPLRDKVMDMEARAKEKVKEAVWKLNKKHQLFRSNSDILTSTSMAAAAPQPPPPAQQVFLEFDTELSKAAFDYNLLEAIPTFGGEHQKFYKFRKEYMIHLGRKSDYSDEEKCYYLKNVLLHSEAKKEVETYKKLQDVWRHLNRLYHRPIPYTSKVLKRLRDIKHIQPRDASSLFRFYGLLWAARAEPASESESFIDSMIQKLPYEEKNEYIKFRRDSSASEFFRFVDKRQQQVSELPLR